MPAGPSDREGPARRPGLVRDLPSPCILAPGAPARLALHGTTATLASHWGSAAEVGRNLPEGVSPVPLGCRLPCVPGAARPSSTQAAAPPPRSALAGADPGAPGNLRSKLPCRHAGGGAGESAAGPRGGVATEGDGRASHQLAKLRTKSTPPTRQTPCLEYTKRLRVPAKENILALAAVHFGGKNMQEWGQVRVWAAPTAGLETSAELEGILGR